MLSKLCTAGSFSKSNLLGRAFSTATEEPLKRTALYDEHVRAGAKMVGFCGWDMPLFYQDGLVASHNHTRTKASLFDVSHMGQLKLTGKDRVKFLERICVADLASQPVGQCKLSVYTNTKGGIIDDTVITNAGDYFYVVVNAGCFDKDLAHYKEQLSAHRGDVNLEVLSDRSLLALQGPLAEKVLSKYVKTDLTKMGFMTAQPLKVDNLDCFVARCGYTGEDGFEISVPSKDAVKLAGMLLEGGEVKWAGLGPRDSLRLEAGLCLYGHDLNEDITPVEGSLSWLIGKRRKEEGGFLGADVVLNQLKNGTKTKRVGFIVEGPPARENAAIYGTNSNEQVGHVTSGSFSPTLNKAIGMAYVSTDLSAVGTPLKVSVRNKQYNATVTKMPFVPTNYKKTK